MVWRAVGGGGRRRWVIELPVGDPLGGDQSNGGGHGPRARPDSLVSARQHSAESSSRRNTIAVRGQLPGHRRPIGEYARVVVEHVLLAPDSGDVPRLRDKTEQIARDVIPSFR